MHMVYGIHIIIQIKIRHRNDLDLLLVHFFFDGNIGQEGYAVACHYRALYRLRGIQLEHDLKFLYRMPLLVQILPQQTVGTELLIEHHHGDPLQVIQGDPVRYVKPVAGHQADFIAERRAAHNLFLLDLTHDKSQVCLPPLDPVYHLIGGDGIQAEGLVGIFVVYLVKTAGKGIVACHRCGCNPECSAVCLKIIKLFP